MNTIRLFGSPPIPPEPLIPIIKASFDHSVQEVRTEALQLTVELHKWVGDSFTSSIQGTLNLPFLRFQFGINCFHDSEMQLRPAQVKELEAAFEARASKEPSPPTPERKLLSNSGSKILTSTIRRRTDSSGRLLTLSGLMQERRLMQNQLEVVEKKRRHLDILTALLMMALYLNL